METNFGARDARFVQFSLEQIQFRLWTREKDPPGKVLPIDARRCVGGGRCGEVQGLVPQWLHH